LSSEQKEAAAQEAADEAQQVIEEQEMKEAKASLDNASTQGKGVNPLNAHQKDSEPEGDHVRQDEAEDVDDSGIKGLYAFRHHMHHDLSQVK
jgi:hypothetical protein